MKRLGRSVLILALGGCGLLAAPAWSEEGAAPPAPAGAGVSQNEEAVEPAATGEADAPASEVQTRGDWKKARPTGTNPGTQRRPATKPQADRPDSDPQNAGAPPPRSTRRPPRPGAADVPDAPDAPAAAKPLRRPTGGNAEPSGPTVSETLNTPPRLPRRQGASDSQDQPDAEQTGDAPSPPRSTRRPPRPGATDAPDAPDTPATARPLRRPTGGNLEPSGPTVSETLAPPRLPRRQNVSGDQDQPEAEEAAAPPPRRPAGNRLQAETGTIETPVFIQPVRYSPTAKEAKALAKKERKQAKALKAQAKAQAKAERKEAKWKEKAAAKKARADQKIYKKNPFLQPYPAPSPAPDPT